VHRDLKPANIKLYDGGKVKILDLKGLLVASRSPHDGKNLTIPLRYEPIPLEYSNQNRSSRLICGRFKCKKGHGRQSIYRHGGQFRKEFHRTGPRVRSEEIAGTPKSVSRLRKSIGNSQIRFRTPKFDWEFPNPVPNSEIPLGTPKSVSELRDSVGNSQVRFRIPKIDWEFPNPFPSSEIRLGTPKSVSRNPLLAQKNRRSRESGSGDRVTTTVPSASPNQSSPCNRTG
jgi:hypothetical protein